MLQEVTSMVICSKRHKPTARHQRNRGFDLVTTTADDEKLVTRDGGFFIANKGLMVMSDNGQNEHPKRRRCTRSPSRSSTRTTRPS